MSNTLTAPNPFVAGFSDLLQRIKQDLTLNGSITGVYICDETDETSDFLTLLVQPLIREVNGRQVTFIGLRNIELKPSLCGKGQFRQFLTDLEQLGHPIILHDVINQRLLKFLLARGYTLHKEQKYRAPIQSCIRL